MPEVEQPQRPSLLRSSTLLAAASTSTLLTGFITGPILARSLGPEGRGLLAAALVPLAIGSQIAALSAGDYANQIVARGERPSVVAWSALPVALVGGLLTAVAMLLLAPTLASGDGTVRDLIRLGAVLVPLGLVVPIGLGVFSGLHRWTPVAIALALPPILNAFAIVMLEVIGELDVWTAGLATVFTGIVGLVPLAIAAGRRGLRPVRVDRSVTRRTVHFGGRSLPGVLAVALNARLDQTLMLSLSNARQLGLYAIAVTIASAGLSLISSVGVASAPVVAAGDREQAARSCRLSIAAAIVVALLLAPTAYPVLAILFGSAFTAAYPMVVILLIAQIPAAGSVVLGYSLRAVDRPGVVSVADIAALGVTVPALFVALPAIGGVGAAVVSLLAYSVAFGLLLRAATREFGLGPAAFTVPGVRDFRPVLERVADALRKAVRSRPEGP